MRDFLLAFLNPVLSCFEIYGVTEAGWQRFLEQRDAFPEGGLGGTQLQLQLRHAAQQL